MALPYRRQNLAKHIRFNDLTDQDVADKLGIEPAEVHNLKFGARYPSPDELRALFDLFGLPVEVLFQDRDMLKYREATMWPPKGSGFRGPRRPVRPFPDIVGSSSEDAR